MAKTNKPTPKNPQANPPVQRFRHRNLEASVWRNPTVKGPMYTVTITRSFKTGDVWRDSHTFTYDDLMNVAKLLYDAHSWISAERAKESAERKTGEANQ